MACFSISRHPAVCRFSEKAWMIASNESKNRFWMVLYQVLSLTTPFFSLFAHRDGSMFFSMHTYVNVYPFSPSFFYRILRLQYLLPTSALSFSWKSFLNNQPESRWFDNLNTGYRSAEHVRGRVLFNAHFMFGTIPRNYATNFIRCPIDSFTTKPEWQQRKKLQNKTFFIAAHRTTLANNYGVPSRFLMAHLVPTTGDEVEEWSCKWK